MAYLFDPKILHDVTKRAVGQPKEAMFRQVIEELAERYPGHIETKQRWIFNNAGGAMGAMTLLHCSLKEYIILFGSPIGTEGHSGRYATEVHDFMLEGEMWCYHEGEFERTVYKPGDAAYLENVTGGAGTTLELWRDGVRIDSEIVDGDDWTWGDDYPVTGDVERYRAELLGGAGRVVVTSHLYVAGDPTLAPEPDGCGCASGGGGGAAGDGAMLALAAALLPWRRRRRAA